MANTMRFLLLADDRASREFAKFADQVARADRRVQSANKSLSAHAAASRQAQNGLVTLAGTITGVGSGFDLATRRTSLFAKALAAVNLATGVAEPLMAGLVATAGGLASATGIAAAGLGAYGVAAAGLIKQVSDLEQAQAKLGTGTKATQQANQKLYQQMLNQAPPAVRGFTAAFDDMRKAYGTWTRSLATPVLAPLTRGLRLVQPLLRIMTPLVRAASGAIGVLVTDLGRSIQGGGLERWVTKILPYVRPVLIALGRSIGHIVAGLGGIVVAFAPVARQLTGGLEQITQRFARWGQTLTSHSGFQALMRMFQQQTPLAVQVLKNLGTVILNISKALAGMLTPANSKLLLQLLMPLSAVMAALSANQALVQTVTMFLLFRKVLVPFGPLLMGFWKAITLVRSGTVLATAAQWALNVALSANPIGIVVMALAALAAAFYVAWTRSATFRKIIIGAWNGVKDTAVAVWRWFAGPFVRFFTETIPDAFGTVLSWVRRNWPWLLGALTGPIGLAVVWIIRHWAQLIGGIHRTWDTVIAFIRKIPGWVLAALAGFGSLLVNRGHQLITGLWNGIRNVWNGVYNWFRGMPGRVGGYFRGALGWLWTAGKNVIWGLYNGLLAIWNKVVSFIKGIPGWIKSHKGPLSLDQRLLYPAGKAIMNSLHLGLLAGAGGPLSFVAGLATTIGDLLGMGVQGLISKLGAGGTAGGGPVSAGAAAAMRFAQSLFPAFGWPMSMWPALRALWMGESSWNRLARNPSSGAYGIPQALPPGKMGAAANPPTSSAAAQIRWGMGYIRAVYGNPGTAYAMWLARSPHWYQQGSWDVPVTGPAVVHRGEMVLPERLADAVRQALTGTGGAGRPVVNVEQMVVQDATDLDLVASRLSFLVTAAGLGS